MELTDFLKDNSISIEDKLIAIRGYLDKEPDMQLNLNGQNKLLATANHYSTYNPGISDDVHELLSELFEMKVNQNIQEYNQAGFRNEINKILEKYS